MPPNLLNESAGMLTLWAGSGIGLLILPALRSFWVFNLSNKVPVFGTAQEFH